jgi:hypothetical protein
MFDSELAERAYAVANDGFADAELGDSTDGPGWYALAVVDGRHVIIREDSQGFVWVDDAETHHTDHRRIMAAWREIEAYFAEFFSEDEIAEDAAIDALADATHAGQFGGWSEAQS